MDNAEEELKLVMSQMWQQAMETRTSAERALCELKHAMASLEELGGYARHSLTSPFGCLVCAISFFLLSWACARSFGLFEYINVRLISVQIVRGGSNSAAFWYLMWPFSILLSWALVPIFRSCRPFDAKNKAWTGLSGTFAALQLFGVLSCFCAAFDRIQDPSREVLESFGQDFGMTMLLLALLQILLFSVSNKRAAEVKAISDQLNAARLNYCEMSTAFVESYCLYWAARSQLYAIQEEKKRQEEAKKREEEEWQRQAHRRSRERFFAERLGEKTNAARALRAHWQTDANVHERNTAYGKLLHLFARFDLNKQDLDEYLSYPYKQAA